MSGDVQYLDLVTLLSGVKEVMAEAFPGPVWVKAEISSWNPRSNGHCYLSLSQSRGGKVVAESRAVIWSWKYNLLNSFFESATGERLHAGLTVLVQVKVNYSELYGLSLQIEGIDPAFTLGEKAQERKRIIERLEKGGFMEMQKELALPELPRRLAVITSPTAAGYQDFRNHLSAGGYAIETELFEATMQGEGAPPSIIEALEEASTQGFDAILILRGGGSETDLACFDDESLAMAIARCPVPVVTAIGHDKDVHIADMVANTSVKTPTALADLFVDLFRTQDAGLDRIRERIVNALERKLRATENEMIRRAGRIRGGLMEKYAALEKLMTAALHRVKFAAGTRIGTETSKIALREALIKASDPRNILSLGYVLVTGRDNKVLKSVEKVSVGDRIGVRFGDGSLTAKVDEIYTENIDNKNINIA